MAVINIGSGSVKLYLKSTGKTEARVTLLGSKNTQAAQETFSAVAYFFSKARAAGESVAIFGTEAMRKSDGSLRSRIKTELGLSVDIIDGQTEALCGFLGATGGQRMTVVDVGGASTELSAGKTAPVFCCSLPVGSVDLQCRFGERETPDSSFLPDIFGYIDGVFKDVDFDFDGYTDTTLIGGSGHYLAKLFAFRNEKACSIKAHFSADKQAVSLNSQDVSIGGKSISLDRKVVNLIGQTISLDDHSIDKQSLSLDKHTAFCDQSMPFLQAASDAEQSVIDNKSKFVSEQPQNERVSSAFGQMGKCASAGIITDKIPDIIKELFALPPSERTKRYPFIDEKRATVLPYGMCIIYRVLRFLNALSARASKTGLIEGYIKYKGLNG